MIIFLNLRTRELEKKKGWKKNWEVGRALRRKGMKEWTIEKISELVVDEWEYEQAGRPREGGTEGCMIWNGWTK